MTTITLSLVSHTNAGKTTLARSLLGREIGDVRDQPHVTEFAERHELIRSAEGDALILWDTPGFGDSARLVRRLRQRDEPLGWMTELWDRWRDHPLWASQQALRHVQAGSDVVLYLVNAAESPTGAGYVASEMELLGWLGKPVLVLLNQLGAPRAPHDEAAEHQAWQARVEGYAHVRGVLAMDAFARCWVHEMTLLDAVVALLDGEQRQAMRRLAAAWTARRQGTFAQSVQVIGESLARIAAAREVVPGGAGIGGALRSVGSMLARRGDATPPAAAQQRLAAALQTEVRASTARLLALHGLHGQAEGEILARVATQFAVHEKVSEGKAAVVGGALSGALVGLKADVLSGGFTLGGGLIAGSLLGALGAAGLARGINLVRGTDQSWVAWSDAALDGAVDAALLRYLAVAHFGRGRGDWAEGEAPAHWRETVAQALAPHRAALTALWQGRSKKRDGSDSPTALAAALTPIVGAALRDALARLYPQATALAFGPPGGEPAPAAAAGEVAPTPAAGAR